jgi:hypothetical protein
VRIKEAQKSGRTTRKGVNRDRGGTRRWVCRLASRVISFSSNNLVSNGVQVNDDRLVSCNLNCRRLSYQTTRRNIALGLGPDDECCACRWRVKSEPRTGFEWSGLVVVNG